MKKIGVLCAALLLLGGCRQALPEECVCPDSGSVPETKVLKLNDDYVEGTLLVKLSSEQMSAAMQEALGGIGVEKAERLFHSVKGKEELESRFGLDRWYELTLASGAKTGQVAAALSGMGEVAMVEYDCRVYRESDCKMHPYEPEPLTKADNGLIFNDPGLVDQWHYINSGSTAFSPNAKKGADINVADVWRDFTTGDPSIVVAVVDEGVKYNHPDLMANMWVNKGEIPGNGIDDDGNGFVDDVYGYNFVTRGAISWDKDGDTGHGTHCAGTIAAVNNNNIGVSGVAGGSGNADGCRIMSCQIFSGGGGAASSVIAKAIKYAADNGASIISCSFGTSTSYSSDDAYCKVGNNALEIDAVHYFEASRNNDVLDGNIAVFAAGNDAHNYAHYPGAFHDIISVTAFAPDYLPTYYTNYGPGCNIVAPGGEAYHMVNNFKSMVLSTVPSEISGTAADKMGKGLDYGYMQGTSMACPHVSGIAALALSYAKKAGKQFSVSRFKEILITSANDLDSRLTGTKTYAYYQKALDLSKFYHQLGTGSIDSYLVMMQIEGIPCVQAEAGRKQWIDLSPYFGTSSTSLSYLSLETISDASSLELAEEPYIRYGRLYIHPTRCGSVRFKITAVGGGSVLGGGSNPPGGMEVSQEVAVIVRGNKSENGGWL